jgi:putative N-acetyltransferase (TIGR04045 family)
MTSLASVANECGYDWPIPPGIVCRPARSERERAAHHAIRHRVFVEEQGVFDATDVEEHDRNETAIHLVGWCDGVAAGSVRLFVLDAATGLWQGDRLAVLEPYRVRGLGAPLVRCAVASAGALGGSRMVAHIQLPNVTFFRHLGWQPAGAIETYAGLPHQPMDIALPTPEAGAVIAQRFADGVSARGR